MILGDDLALDLLRRAARGRMLGVRSGEFAAAPYLTALRLLAQRGLMREIEPADATPGRVEFEITSRGRAAVPGRKRPQRKPPSDRDHQIASAATTASYESVGELFGLSKQRVHQIVKRVADWDARPNQAVAPGHNGGGE